MYQSWLMSPDKCSRLLPSVNRKGGWVWAQMSSWYFLSLGRFSKPKCKSVNLNLI